MPFGIPSEDFYGGFGLPRTDERFYIVDAESCKNRDSVVQDDYDPYTGKYAFCPPSDEDEVCVINYDDTDGNVSDEEYEAAAQEAYDNLVRSLIEAGGEIRELKKMLREAKDALFYMLILHDSAHGHNMQKVIPILYQLQSNNGWTVQKAQEIFKKICEYCEENKI